MGVKNLNKFITKKYAKGITTLSKKYLHGKVIGIDMSLIIYKMMTVSIGNKFKRIGSNGKDVTHIYAIFYKMMSFLKIVIITICVFDWEPPKLKQKTKEQRREIKSQNEKNAKKLLECSTTSELTK